MRASRPSIAPSLPVIQNSVVANFATTADDGKTCQVDYYNLDAIISVGSWKLKSLRRRIGDSRSRSSHSSISELLHKRVAFIGRLRRLGDDAHRPKAFMPVAQ